MNTIDKKWRVSVEFMDAVAAFKLRTSSNIEEEFEQSDEFRNARHRFRKRVNGSWNLESC